MSAPRRQRGIAAIELAIVAGVCCLLLPYMLVFGRVFWQYSVLQKAVHDAARYMASVPGRELGTEDGFTAARTRARAMVRAAAIAGRIDAPPPLETISVDCYQACMAGEDAPPQTVRIYAAVRVKDELFGDAVTFFPRNGLLLQADVTLRHVN